MSATRDKSQKFTFVYSNLYQIYKKDGNAGPAEVPASFVPVTRTVPGLTTGRVLKAEAVSSSAPKIEPYQPVELIGKRVAKPEVFRTGVISQSVRSPHPNDAIKSLKNNLKALNDLHSRLRFMLQELEDLVKE